MSLIHSQFHIFYYILFLKKTVPVDVDRENLPPRELSKICKAQIMSGLVLHLIRLAPASDTSIFIFSASHPDHPVAEKALLADLCRAEWEYLGVVSLP